MPTPVGPVAPDPNDPDLWTEWYDDDDFHDDGGFHDDGASSGYGWPVRVLALLAILAVIVVLVL